MFGWFKRKPETVDAGVLDEFIEKFEGPSILATGIAIAAKEYVDGVRAGRLKHPAHLHKDLGVLGIWRGVENEALLAMFGFGQADVMLLAEQPKQAELLTCFLDERPYLEMPQPRGEVMADTIQSIGQVYQYLTEVGSSVADRETDRLTLRYSKNKSILDALIEQACHARDGWKAFETAMRTDSGTLPERPATLIEIVYKDVTLKSKSIALSTIFGPLYEENIKYLSGRISNDQARKDFDELVARIMNATDPDDVENFLEKRDRARKGIG
jgi:hypothetical protein